MTISVLVVDDSALIRQLLGEMISTAPGFKLAGLAEDAYQARDFVNKYAPDVITLDIEMPRMDGLSFLELLMKARPTPVIMVSTLTEQGADATLRALELGAVDFLTKPKIDVSEGIAGYCEELLEKIRAAAAAGPALRRKGRANVKARSVPRGLKGDQSRHILAIGASTGGTEAIRAFLEALPPEMPGIVITQHMPAGFTRTFSARLDRLCQLSVCEAKDGDKIIPGYVYIAPGGLHLEIERSGINFICRLSDAPPVSRHKPSVDVLFDSVAQSCGSASTGVILTGMGRDGASGLLNMHENGAQTFAQDENSCVIFGMPRVAIESGAVDTIASLDDLPELVVNHLKSVCRRRS
ncbi:protein-glutamate methylesterase/protein-glutamine glutaminase [Marinobacter sp. NSM]|uniref:protein-glutamate methylesterase/protein-glutamine glutaminase n=1 Tax=Marinobacter sp. NSM TaxID=3458004 RepID=UPI0040367D11